MGRRRLGNRTTRSVEELPRFVPRDRKTLDRIHLHHGMHEQSPISRENCSILSDHDLKEAAIIGAGFVNRIES